MNNIASEGIVPTYLYKDLDNGDIYELKQGMRDEPFTRHPETGTPVKRILSRPAIAFKGSGFYANDSRASTTKESASKDSASKDSTSKESAPKESAPKTEAAKPAPAASSAGGE